MKKMTLLISVFLLFSLTNYCEKEDEPTFHEILQGNIQDVYKAIGDSLLTYEVTDSVHLHGVVEEHYLNMLGANANLELYHIAFGKGDSLLAIPNTIEEEILENKVDSILALSTTEAIAIEKCEQMLASKTLTHNERTVFILIKETLVFFEAHGEILGVNIEGKGGESINMWDWWNRHGRCCCAIIAGTIGGGFASGMAGCVFTGPACPAGAIVGICVGAVGGALAGGVAFC